MFIFAAKHDYAHSPWRNIKYCSMAYFSNKMRRKCGCKKREQYYSIGDAAVSQLRHEWNIAGYVLNEQKPDLRYPIYRVQAYLDLSLGRIDRSAIAHEAEDLVLSQKWTITALRTRVPIAVPSTPLKNNIVYTYEQRNGQVDGP
jgi:hypothetical protein